MSDPFSQLIPEARVYLAELSANNRRDWFNDQKPRYEAELKTPALMLLDQIAAEIARGDDLSVTTKLFRPQRDVRFSKDKTPYNVHLHMGWTLTPREGAATGLFFGVAPDYVRIGGGIMGFDKEHLTRWRAAVDGDLGPRIDKTLRASGLQCEDPELKRIPAPYAKDHPFGELLRRKSLTLWRDVPEDSWPAPQAALMQTYAQLTPVLTLLREAV